MAGKSQQSLGANETSMAIMDPMDMSHGFSTGWPSIWVYHHSDVRSRLVLSSENYKLPMEIIE